MSRGFETDTLNNQLLFSLPMFEGSGSATLRDVARPHHPVTQVHAPAWTQISPSGIYALDFDGANDYLYVALASAADLNFTSSDFSGCLWVYPDTVTGERELINNVQWNTKGWQFNLGWPHAGCLAFYTCQAGANQLTEATSALVTSLWQLVGFSRSGSSVRLYVCGRDVMTEAGSHNDPVASATNFFVGHYGAGTSWYDGLMWNPRIWGRALSPAEHRSIFNREKHLFPGVV